MLEAPHCRGEGVFIQCIIRGFSSPFQRNVAPEMCRGLEGGSVGRVYVQAAPLAWSQRGWIHAANATPGGTLCGAGVGEGVGWEQDGAAPHQAVIRPHPPPVHSPLPQHPTLPHMPTKWGRKSDFSPSALAAPRGSAREVAARDRVPCHPAGPPPPHPLVPWMNPKFVVGARASLPRGSGAAEDSGGGGRGVGAASLGSKTKPGSCSVQCL